MIWWILKKLLRIEPKTCAKVITQGYHETSLLLEVTWWQEYLLLSWFWIRVTVMSMHISSFKSRISLLAEVSQIIYRRETISLIIWETSASREVLDGKVISLWKTEKGKIITLIFIWIFAHGSMRLWSRMIDCWRTSCTLIYWISISSQ